MTRLKKLFYLVAIIFNTTPLIAQNAEALAANIAKTYCDSLTENIPLLYDAEQYAKVENYWDKKIFILKKQEIDEYLKLTGQFRPKNGLLKEEVIYNIAEKAVKGCAFYMGFYGKGSKNTDIKPSLTEVVNGTCTCIEQKTTSMTSYEMFGSKQQEVMGFIQECSSQSIVPLRDKIILEYAIKDKASIQRYGNISSGYLFISCPKFIKSVALAKVATWADLLSLRIRKEYNQAGWHIVNATKQKINDTLTNQFSDNSRYKKALPELQKSEQLLKENPAAYIFTRPNDIGEIKNRAIHEFICADNKKVLFQIIIEYESDAYGKVRTVKFVPRNKIQNLMELDEDIRTTPAPPLLPPPPTSVPSKN